MLACGAELKNTFCLGREDRAFLSHHVGDLENYETLRSFTEGIGHFRRLFDVTPQIVAHDLHPDYLSTRYALEQDDCVLAGVQHHHAHIASCLADNGEAGPVIGVAFDGTGYGPDGTIWGGEFLLADLADAERAGHLAGVPMPGGAAAIRQPWRMAAAYLDAAFPGGLPGGLDVVVRNQEAWPTVLTLGRRGMNSPLTSSAGRLFDAVASLLGLRDVINYEGQAAVELEQLALTSRHDPYQAAISGGRPFTVAGPDLVRAAAEDLLAGVPRQIISARFHQGVAAMIGEACGLLRERSGLGTVALSGGVFQNLLLLADRGGPAGGHGLPGPDPFPGPAERRRDQPGTGCGGRGMGSGRAAGFYLIANKAGQGGQNTSPVRTILRWPGCRYERWACSPAIIVSKTSEKVWQNSGSPFGGLAALIRKER